MAAQVILVPFKLNEFIQLLYFAFLSVWFIQFGLSQFRLWFLYVSTINLNCCIICISKSLTHSVLAQLVLVPIFKLNELIFFVGFCKCIQTDGMHFKGATGQNGQLLLLQYVSFSMFDQMEPSQKPSQAKQPVQLPTTTATATNVTILSYNEPNRCELQLRDASSSGHRAGGRGGGACCLVVVVVVVAVVVALAVLWLGMRLGRFVACAPDCNIKARRLLVTATPLLAASPPSLIF